MSGSGEISPLLAGGTGRHRFSGLQEMEAKLKTEHQKLEITIPKTKCKRIGRLTFRENAVTRVTRVLKIHSFL